MIQYIQVETDEKGKIIGLAFVDSKLGGYSQVKKMLPETSGLPEDASARDHISRIKSKAYVVGINDGTEHAKNILAQHSGLDPKTSVEDHIAAIKLKVYDEGYDDGRRDMRTDIQERMK